MKMTLKIRGNKPNGSLKEILDIYPGINFSAGVYLPEEDATEYNVIVEGGVVTSKDKIRVFSTLATSHRKIKGFISIRFSYENDGLPLPLRNPVLTSPLNEFIVTKMPENGSLPREIMIGKSNLFSQRKKKKSPYVAPVLNSYKLVFETPIELNIFVNILKISTSVRKFHDKGNELTLVVDSNHNLDAIKRAITTVCHSTGILPREILRQPVSEPI